jgi:hypothetical protein
VLSGCTSVAQPVDVGFNSLLKSHVKTKYVRWQIFEYRQHYANNHNQPNLKLPSPSTSNIVEWVLSANKEIPEATIRKTFLSIIFVFQVRPNINVEIDDGNLSVDNDDNDDDIDSLDDENKSSDDERIVRNPQRIVEV